MIRRLIRKCPRCNSVIKLILVDGKITELEGAEQPRVNVNYRDQRQYASGKYDLSQKTVCCTTRNREHMDGWSSCWQAMLVRNFKEIKV